MHCERCGAEINRGAHFCGNCGAPVQGRTAPPSRPMSERLRDIAGRTRRERMLAAGTALALLAAVVAFFLLDTPEDDSTANDAFVEASDALCVDAKQRIAEISDGRLGDSGASRESYVSNLLVATLDWRLALEDLADSQGARADAKPLVDALKALSFDLGTLARVSREAPRSELASVAADADAATGDVEAAISDAGMERCAAISLAPAGEAPG